MSPPGLRGGAGQGDDMPTTDTEAYEAMLAHHRILGEQLNERVNAVAAAAAGQPRKAAVAGLAAFLAGEILPHAAAEEETIYPAAAALDGLAGTVSEMIAEHRALAEAAGRLAGMAGAADAAGLAEEIARLFAAHVARENDVLLPALLASGNADLSALLASMHARTEQAAHAAAAAGPALDVRSMPPARRHEAIAAAYQALAPGAGFLLINDHDPKPLRYQFQAEHAGEFTWDYLEEGPERWRVRIGRATD